VGIYFKNNLLFIPVFLYVTVKFESIYTTLKFIKYLIFGGIFFAFYLIFEFLNKILGLFPIFNNLIFEYLSSSKNDYLAVFADSDKFKVESAIRPLGLELNFTSGAFFLSSIFLIILFSGWRVFGNFKIRVFFQVVLFLAVIISTSRQNLLFLSLFIVFIFLQSIFGTIFNRYKLHGKETRFSIYVIVYSLIFFGLYMLTNEQVYTDFLLGKSGGTSEILLEDISSLFNNLSFFLLNYPFNFLFGIGAYTPEAPGIYYNLQPVNELHFFLDTFYSLGLVGFVLFWFVFIASFKNLRRYKNSNILKELSNFDDLKASFTYITILFVCSNVHYSPIGLITIYIIALIILIPIQLKNGLYIRNIS
jgi:hypothetical protein